MQKLNKEKAIVERALVEWTTLHQRVEDAQVLYEMAVEAKDEDSFLEAKTEVDHLEGLAHDLELKQMLNGEQDTNSCYLTINAGSGGTEAQDWAELLMRMYMRYAEKHGYKVDTVEINYGEQAGIKSCTLGIDGLYAYGYLKAEAGVHRLVRVSPFDSNARRHTSFAGVFCWAQVDEDIKVEIRPEDIKTDTYRASGAGGQHVNKTDSAVRLTHIPTGIVVQCQNERSQHSNRDKAMKMLKAALYQKELEERNKEKDAMNATKKANEWGSQIRSYVLDDQRIKDHRTSYQTSQVSKVLDGDLDGFIQAYLKALTTGEWKAGGD